MKLAYFHDIAKQILSKYIYLIFLLMNILHIITSSTLACQFMVMILSKGIAHLSMFFISILKCHTSKFKANILKI